MTAAAFSRAFRFIAAAALAALVAVPTVQAQSGGGNERMPGGVERSQDPADGAASSSVKPSTAPRMGTTRGLTGAPKPPPAPPVAAPPATTPAPAAPASRGVSGGSSSEGAPAPAPPKGKGYDETLPGGVERSPSSR